MQQTPLAALQLFGSSGIRKVAQATRPQFAGAAECSRQLHLAAVACTARPAAAVGVGAARAGSTAAAAHAAAGGTPRQLGMPAPYHSKTYATASAPPPPLVLVKVGDGKDLVFEPAGADVAAMDRMTLLKALAKDEGFGGSLTGVNLDKCTVRVVKSASKLPSAEEEAAAVELLSIDALEDHTEAGKHLFVRVALPAPTPTAKATSVGVYSDVGICGCSLVHTEWAPSCRPSDIHLLLHPPHALHSPCVTPLHRYLGRVFTAGPVEPASTWHVRGAREREYRHAAQQRLLARHGVDSTVCALLLQGPLGARAAARRVAAGEPWRRYHGHPRKCVSIAAQGVMHAAFAVRAACSCCRFPAHDLHSGCSFALSCHGHSAVAKSAFGLYALYRAAREGRTVIYAARKGGFVVFKGGKAFKTSAGELLRLDDMGDGTALYISDYLPPAVRAGAFRLLITPPKKENWSEFVKSPAIKQLVLPVFNEQEMLELRAAAFGHKAGCSEPEVKERFKLWGGVARSVLTYGHDAAEQARLTTVARSLKIDTLENALAGTTALDGVGGSDYAHRLLELVPCGALDTSRIPTSDPEYYRFNHAQLITDHVVSLVANALADANDAELYRFLHRSTTDPAVATLRGRLYERGIVLRRLRRGPGEHGVSNQPLS
jgi:hypothetical protein